MGKVFLVGGGPGDPGLLTLRAARLLRRADVVIHDALISEAILDLAPTSAERIDVGKRGGGRHTHQAEIHRILIDAARRARTVVRLKGGDPFVFGRGGEEALALREAGIRYAVVPGVTAALGAAAYAGIPLTHRGLSAGVTFVTGHECAHAGEEQVDWERLGRSSETLVVYMGVRSLPRVTERLLGAGRSPDTPAAVIEWGTYARQRTVTAPLATITERAQAAGLGAPALVVIGKVAGLRRELAWFERRPLHGVRVLVPRSRSQPSRLAATLTGLGADVTQFPRMAVLPTDRPGELRGAVRDAAHCGWVVFTSPTAVERFWAEAFDAELDARAFAGVRFACFGTATGAALRRRGIRPDVAEPTFVPAVAAEALQRAGGVAGARVLFVRGSEGSSRLAQRLGETGAVVREVEAYREVIRPGDADAVRRRLDAGEIDVVAFASSETVRRFVKAVGGDAGRAAVAVIGAETARTALSLGLPLHVAPGEATLNGLVGGLREYARRAGRGQTEPGAAPGGARVAAQR